MALIDLDDLLTDDRPLVEVRGHVMGGRSHDLAPASMGLVVRLGAPEARQERVVDVDDPAFEAVAQLVEEHLHVLSDSITKEFYIEKDRSTPDVTHRICSTRAVCAGIYGT